MDMRNERANLSALNAESRIYGCAAHGCLLASLLIVCALLCSQLNPQDSRTEVFIISLAFAIPHCIIPGERATELPLCHINLNSCLRC